MKIIKMHFSTDGQRQEEYLYIITGIFRKRIYMIKDHMTIPILLRKPTQKGSE